MVEWYLFLPQVRLSAADIAERARRAEASGFDGIAFIDHLEAPGLRDESIWEAMGIATWVAAKTERLRIGHLVLCDAFRHPAVLAKQAVTLSEAAEGRFELGLGAGSGRPNSPDSMSASRIRRPGWPSSRGTSNSSSGTGATTGAARRRPRDARIRYRWCWAEAARG